MKYFLKGILKIVLTILLGPILFVTSIISLICWLGGDEEENISLKIIEKIYDI